MAPTDQIPKQRRPIQRVTPQTLERIAFEKGLPIEFGPRHAAVITDHARYVAVIPGVA